MELRVLKYFLMVAREENITKAAQLLHITQPTLSRQLMLLEEELGTRLFLRGRHNITLTDDGLLLKRRAQVQHELAAWFGSTYEHLQIAATFNLFVNAAIMVKHYVGTALILDLGTTLYDSLRFIPLAPQLENGAVLVWKKNLVSSRVVSAFINHIQQYPIENTSLNC